MTARCQDLQSNTFFCSRSLHYIRLAYYPVQQLSVNLCSSKMLFDPYIWIFPASFSNDAAHFSPVRVFDYFMCLLFLFRFCIHRARLLLFFMMFFLLAVLFVLFVRAHITFSSIFWSFHLFDAILGCFTYAMWNKTFLMSLNSFEFGSPMQIEMNGIIPLSEYLELNAINPTWNGFFPFDLAIVPK